MSIMGAGEMSDAAEVMSAIYDSLRTVPGGGELVDAVFGLHVEECVHCSACGRDTHKSAYTQFFYNTSATALRLQVSLVSVTRQSPCMHTVLSSHLGGDMPL